MKNSFFKKMIKIENISNKEKLALGVTILCLVIVISSFLFNIETDSSVKIEYDSISVEKLEESAIVSSDKQVYFDLQEIIFSYLYSYNLEVDVVGYKIDYEKIKYTREEYYEVLTEDYKNYINKKEYLNISKSFCEKFLEENDYGKYVILDNQFIKKIYKLNTQKYGKNMYICELNTSNNDEIAYIGIYLNSTKKTYNIFYIQ